MVGKRLVVVRGKCQERKFLELGHEGWVAVGKY